MSEDRTYSVLPERRTLGANEGREEEVLAEERTYGVIDEERVLEVLLT